MLSHINEVKMLLYIMKLSQNENYLKTDQKLNVTNSKSQAQIRCFYTLRAVQVGNQTDETQNQGKPSVLLPTQSREEKATETIVHFK